MIRFVVATAAVLALSLASTTAGEPQIEAIAFGAPGQPYVPLLNGPPQTHSLHSGLVVLAPGAHVGAHTTGKNEEMLIPLDGEGELRFEHHPPIHLKPGLVTYAPPFTRHDVVNTASVPLRYIYVTAVAVP